MVTMLWQKGLISCPRPIPFSQTFNPYNPKQPKNLIDLPEILRRKISKRKTLCNSNLIKELDKTRKEKYALKQITDQPHEGKGSRISRAVAACSTENHSARFESQTSSLLGNDAGISFAALDFLFIRNYDTEPWPVQRAR